MVSIIFDLEVYQQKYQYYMGQNVCGSSNQRQQNTCIQIEASESENFPLQNLQQDDQSPNPLRRWLDKNNLNTFSVKVINQKQNLERTPNANSNKQNSILFNNKKDVYSSIKASLQLNSVHPIKQEQLNQKQNNMRKSEAGKNYQPIPINIENFVCVKQQKITENYQILQQIGQGNFGNVYIAKCLATNQLRAIKTLKQRFMNQEQKRSFFNEINILRKLDHPNIIKLYEVFIWNNFFYVVMQYCQGGSVLSSIKKKQTYSEATVSKIMKQLLNAVSYFHTKGIVHRDLKLQNMVFEKKISLQAKNEFNIKIIDFGLAVDVFSCKSKKNEIAGSKPYMSPQALKGTLTTKNDIWSCGVILVILLTGKNPFLCPHIQTMIKIINQKDIFTDPIWKKLSQGANDLAFNLLKKNHQKRITGQKAMKHEWIVSNSQEKQKMIQSAKRYNTILQNLSSYERGNNFVAVIRSFLTFKRINQEQRKQLTELFQSLDKDNSGMIQKKQLLQCYVNTMGEQSTKDIEDILLRIDFNNSGKIDFSQFLTVTYNKKKLLMTEALRQAFNHFDMNRSGYLQLNQIKSILNGSSSSQITEIFRAIDTDDDKLISFKEFANYLQKNLA